MLREYYARALTPTAYFSVDSAQGGEAARAVYQVVSAEIKGVFEKTFLDSEPSTGLFRVVVQPLEVWSGVVGDVAVLDEIHCYILGEPCTLDVIEIVGCRLSSRDFVLRWSGPGESCVDACFLLNEPEIATGV